MFYNNQAMMSKNLLLTGPPGIGKTTVVKSVIDILKQRLDGPPLCGFYTEEVRKEGQRIGFLIKTLRGREGLLAHRDFPSPHRVGKYGVSLENLENIAIPIIEAPCPGGILIIDEIGKMECFSTHFVRAVAEALDSPVPVISTIGMFEDRQIRNFKLRADVTMLEISLQNRDSLPTMIVRHILERE